MANENPARIEPSLLQVYPRELGDLLAELPAAAALLGVRLHPVSAGGLASMVRVMNCYYSNLIEGHNTQPRDIERALVSPGTAIVKDNSSDPDRRDLQLEARAHMRVQAEVDALHASQSYGEPASRERIRWLHREFYRGASERMLRVEHADGPYQLVPGELRSEPRHDVIVGRHHPPSSARVADFMAYFEQRYQFTRLGPGERIVAMAAAHHRFNYIHPFPDGNGRVSRLMSHAMALQAGIGAHGLWSIARGLARGLRGPSEYKTMMDAADSPRRGDLDGRGNLSLEALNEFVIWFCRVALDQIRFMTSMFEFDRLAERLSAYVQETLGLSAAAAEIPLEVLRVGELPRGQAARTTKQSERTAREALSALVHAKLLISDTPKGPVRLHFNSENANPLFPRLF